MGEMSPNKRRAVGVVVLGLGALALAVRLTHPRRAFLPPPRPPRSEAAYVHPIVPSPPVVTPPPPTCRARDLHDVARATRQTEKKIAEASARGEAKGAPASCRQAPEDRALVGQVDLLARVTSGCVARDATLDSQWNLVQSAAVALDACADCTRPRGARTVSCTRAIELLGAAEKATP
jgi:hypothetical protein